MTDERMSEKDFQTQVISLAGLYGWRHYHTYDSRRSVAGFPDLVLVREGRVIFAELKTERGKMTLAQQDWLQALRQTPVETYLWRPSDWDRIMKILSYATD